MLICHSARDRCATDSGEGVISIAGGSDMPAIRRKQSLMIFTFAASCDS
jgi:hypothetical protein